MLAIECFQQVRLPSVCTVLSLCLESGLLNLSELKTVLKTWQQIRLCDWSHLKGQKLPAK